MEPVFICWATWPFPGSQLCGAARSQTPTSKFKDFLKEHLIICSVVSQNCLSIEKVPFSNNLISLILVFFPFAQDFTVHWALSHTLTWTSWKLCQGEGQRVELFHSSNQETELQTGGMPCARMGSQDLHQALWHQSLPAFSPLQPVIPRSHSPRFWALECLTKFQPHPTIFIAITTILILIVVSLSPSSLWISSKFFISRDLQVSVSISISIHGGQPGLGLQPHFLIQAINTWGNPSFWSPFLWVTALPVLPSDTQTQSPDGWRVLEWPQSGSAGLPASACTPDMPVPIIYSCKTNHPKTQWFKTPTISFAHESATWAMLSWVLFPQACWWPLMWGWEWKRQILLWYYYESNFDFTYHLKVFQVPTQRVPGTHFENHYHTCFSFSIFRVDMACPEGGPQLAPGKLSKVQRVLGELL